MKTQYVTDLVKAISAVHSASSNTFRADLVRQEERVKFIDHYINKLNPLLLEECIKRILEAK